jgi:hypothetical protein
MKKVLLFLSFFIYSVTSPCQQIPNGNMELWDSSDVVPFPVNWLTNAFYASLPCWPPPFSVFQTNDANSGDYAAKLEAVGCIDDNFVQRVYIGFLACGNNSNPTLAHGIPYSGKPDYLNFYYKFSKVGTDTGFVHIALRLYDSLGYAGPVVGEGKYSIISDTNNYTYVSLPVNYLLPDTPEILQVLFSTSKTLVDNNYLLSTTPGNGAYIGTTLWIDDVTFSGGTIAIPELLNEKLWQIYPNPTNDFSIIEFKSLSSNSNLKIFNSQGKLVKSVKNISNDNVKIEKDNLKPGVYYFLINNELKELSKGKWIIY